jgi:hypothetical protein
MHCCVRWPAARRTLLLRPIAALYSLAAVYCAGADVA